MGVGKRDKKPERVTRKERGVLARGCLRAVSCRLPHFWENRRLIALLGLAPSPKQIPNLTNSPLTSIHANLKAKRPHCFETLNEASAIFQLLHFDLLLTASIWRNSKRYLSFAEHSLRTIAQDEP